MLQIIADYCHLLLKLVKIVIIDDAFKIIKMTLILFFDVLWFSIELFEIS